MEDIENQEAPTDEVDHGPDDLEEDTVLVVDTAVGVVISKIFLVGKVISNIQISAVAVAMSMTKMWRLKGDFRVTGKGNNTFFVGFDFEEDKIKVQKGVPWLVRNHHFLLVELPPILPLKQVSLNSSFFWIHVYGIPPQRVNERTAGLIGNCFLGLDRVNFTLENMFSWKGYVRMRVRIDVDKPLKPGLFLKRGIEHRLWIKFQYERLGDFCFSCGLLHHTVKFCPQEKRPLEGIEREAIDSFWPWMKVESIYNQKKLLQGSKFHGAAKQAKYEELNPTPLPQENLDEKVPTELDGSRPEAELVNLPSGFQISKKTDQPAPEVEGNLQEDLGLSSLGSGCKKRRLNQEAAKFPEAIMAQGLHQA